MMHLNYSLALRNIFRNTRRTALTICLIASGLAALLFTDAFIRGMSVSMIKTSTETFLGDAQIHQQGFREASDIDIYLKDNNSLYQKLENIKQIKSYAPRILTGAMLSSSENVTSVIVYGVNAEKESQISKLKQAMIKGHYLTAKKGEIIIGDDLADLLEVDLGDRLVVTVSQAHGGDLSQELFRVSGLYHFDDRFMNKGLAVINLQQGQEILNIQGVHEIALRFNNVQQASDTRLTLWAELNNKELETLNWRQLIPQLSSMLDMSQYSTLIVSIIMSLLVALGLINSMFMSIYERHHEFGILLAVGTRPRQLFWLILLEGFYIGMLSIIAGVFLGGVISYWKSVTGIDYSGTEFSGVSMSEPIYLIIDVLAFIKISGFILAITVLSCVYPALHAARLQPSLAMRKAL
ncbi:MAG: hypothetical protein DIZ80_02350 [endosymbiont of Galathealinum brachiosum]|uniref:ABC transporter permease n=1 Tax=endosymbiont of Galathealinum brachiosum TaxID=2200906 RepID=A0A370DK45_9GAMM|nr:MAG: hypothetical protein DIZ80_02350 [endosymbiont of Galathealinum brachiosum]